MLHHPTCPYWILSSLNLNIFLYKWGFPGGSDSKESACNVGDPGSIPGWGQIPWRRKWQLISVFLPGKSYGQRSLVGTVHGVTKSRTQLSN